MQCFMNELYNIKLLASVYDVSNSGIPHHRHHQIIENSKNRLDTKAKKTLQRKKNWFDKDVNHVEELDKRLKKMRDYVDDTLERAEDLKEGRECSYKDHKQWFNVVPPVMRQHCKQAIQILKPRLQNAKVMLNENHNWF